jgi:hypothetical protein
LPFCGAPSADGTDAAAATTAAITSNLVERPVLVIVIGSFSSESQLVQGERGIATPIIEDVATFDILMTAVPRSIRI